MDIPVVTLPEELFLLALDTQTGRPRCNMRYLRYGLAGAALAELESAGRIAERGGRIHVTDPAPTGEDVLDAALESLVREDGARVRRWIRRGAAPITEASTRELAGRGAVRIESDRVLGLFPRRRYPLAGTDWSAPVVKRFTAAAYAGLPDSRSRDLGALVAAVDLAPKLFPGHGDNARLRKQLRQLSRQQWPAEAVRRTVSADKSAAASS